MSAKTNPAIGVDSCYVAKLVSDPDTGAPSWNTPVKLPGVVKLTVNANGALITDWADNKAFFVTNSRGNTQVSMENVNIDPAILADMLGQTRANGITLEKALDQSAYYALGFRVWIGGTDDSANKIYRYIWLLKGKFAVPSTNGETKKATITPQHMTLTAEFIALNSADYDNLIMTHGRTDADLTVTVASAWFNAPVVSTGVDVTAVTVAITADDTNNQVVFTFAKGGATYSMAEASAIVGAGVLVIKSGVSQAGTIAWSGEASTAVVAKFTPTVAFGTSTILASVSNDVKDVNGVGVTPNAASLSFTA
jgi:phi13 family phage major tail protein